MADKDNDGDDVKLVRCMFCCCGLWWLPNVWCMYEHGLIFPADVTMQAHKKKKHDDDDDKPKAMSCRDLMVGAAPCGATCHAMCTPAIMGDDASGSVLRWGSRQAVRQAARAFLHTAL